MKPIQYLEFFEGKSNNAHLISFDNGKQYIVKFLKKGQEKTLLNEWLGYSIARYMNLPIPPSRFVEIPKTFLKEMIQTEDILYTSRQFATLYIPDCKNAHELQNPNIIINSDQLAGIIILDYWLYNTDRTRKNILFKEESNKNYHLHIIDHADSFGSFAWKKEDLQKIDQQNLLKSATHELIASFIVDKNELYQQFNIIRAIPALLLKEILDFAPEDWLVTKDEKEEIIDFLLFRRENVLPTLIQKFIGNNF
jgi:hypothetical protein